MMIHGFTARSCTRTSSASPAPLRFTGKASRLGRSVGGCQRPGRLRADLQCRGMLRSSTPRLPHPRHHQGGGRGRQHHPRIGVGHFYSGRAHRRHVGFSIAAWRLCRGRRQGCGVRSHGHPAREHLRADEVRAACCSISSRPHAATVSRKARPSPTDGLLGRGQRQSGTADHPAMIGIVPRAGHPHTRLREAAIKPLARKHGRAAKTMAMTTL